MEVDRGICGHVLPLKCVDMRSICQKVYLDNEIYYCFFIVLKIEILLQVFYLILISQFCRNVVENVNKTLIFVDIFEKIIKINKFIKIDANYIKFFLIQQLRG